MIKTQPKQLFLFLSILVMLIGAFYGCSFTQKIKDGNTAFDRKYYPLAIELLKKEQGKAKTRAEKSEKSYKIAESLKLMGKYSESLDWYKKAYDDGFGPDAFKGYAYMLKTVQRYEDAQKAFKDLGIEIGSVYEYRKEIAICKQAAGWLKDLPYSPYTIENAPFNSAQLDFAAVPFGEDILFTSDRSSSIGNVPYHWTGNDFMDFFIAAKDDNQAEAFEAFSSEHNEGTLSLSADGNLVIFCRCDGSLGDKDYCRLYQSQRDDNDGWTAPELLSFVQDGINYIQPALHEDGKQLFFVSDDSEGWGGYDIYRSMLENGAWSFPEMLSRSINSEGDEVFPSLDGDTLYFSSNHWPGMGGLDVFKSFPINKRAWSPAYVLPVPINSGADDFGFIISNISKKTGLPEGYLTSSREGGKGQDDIYFFNEIIPKERPKPPVVDTIKEKPIVVEKKLELNIYVLEKIYAQADEPNSKVLGRKPVADAAITIIQEKDMATKATSNTEGLHSLIAKLESEYKFTARKEGYLSGSAEFNSSGISLTDDIPVLSYDIEIVLDKIIKNKEIILENIYYDFDKWNIREDAKPTLNSLANTLRENPNITIQLSSHTDCRGKEKYNETLSQQRAQSAVDYLISVGIKPTRLRAKGYGKSSLLINCKCTSCTDSEHQANRRTTFKIVDQ